MKGFLRVAAVVVVPAVAATLGVIVAARTGDQTREPNEIARDSLTQEVALRSEAGTAVVRFPPGWQAGQSDVNCAQTRDLHVSTSEVGLESITVERGSGRGCIGQLDPRPLPSGAAYVSIAFIPVVAGSCDPELPDVPPGSLADVEVQRADPTLLDDYDAGDAYQGVEWRRYSWCASEQVIGRVEVFVRDDASQETRTETEAVVDSLELRPA